MGRRFSFAEWLIRPSPVRGRGFTLVELLVVIAIIATLIGLLLPAVQSARGSARRMQCMNNLRTLGQGLLIYENSHKNFPPGATSNGRSKPFTGAYSWAALILPFIEESALYAGLNPTSGGPAKDATNQPLLRTALKAFRCPEDRGPETWDVSQTGKDGDSGEYILNGGLSNYVAAHRAVAAFGSGVYTSGTDSKVGGFFLDSKTRMKDISDGTTKSIALSERVWMYPAGYMRGSVGIYAGTWAGAGGPINGDASWVQPTSFAPAKLINDPTASRTHRSLSSLHLGGGVNAVAFDNSTRFISDNIDHFTGLRDDGSPADTNGKDALNAVDSVLEYLIAIKDRNPVSFP